MATRHTLIVSKEGYAVRWAWRRLKRALGWDWTKWHWSTGDGFTLCGRIAPVCAEKIAFMGYVPDKGMCKTCKRKAEPDAP